MGFVYFLCLVLFAPDRIFHAKCYLAVLGFLVLGATMEFKGRDIISIEDFTQQEINHILDVAKTMEPFAKTGSDMLKGKILATLFFEPSTRTRLSFETAMLKLGGNIHRLRRRQT